MEWSAKPLCVSSSLTACLYRFVLGEDMYALYAELDIMRNPIQKQTQQQEYKPKGVIEIDLYLEVKRERGPIVLDWDNT